MSSLPKLQHTPHRRQQPPTALVHAVTVVVPTRNERDNIGPLVDRLSIALAGRRALVLFVDDSDDDTPEQVLRTAAASQIDVRLIHRAPAERRDGLGGAVLAGFRAARSEWLVVMDGDLQHPPEVVPDLIETARRANAQLVVASRHAVGGSHGGLAGVWRVAVSRASILLSKSLFPRALSGVSDPMSGFFAVRRDAVDLERMQPRGFKVLLELLARHGDLVRVEVPFEFATRLNGVSKASVSEGVLFARRLLALRLSSARGGGRPGTVGRALGFAAVGMTGLLVNVAVMWLLADPAMLGINYLVAAVLTTQVSSTWNYLLVDGLVYPGPKRHTKLSRYLAFLGLSNLVLVLRIPLLALLVSTLGVHYLAATVLTLLLGYAVRFGSHERLTLREEPS